MCFFALTEGSALTTFCFCSPQAFNKPSVTSKSLRSFEELILSQRIWLFATEAIFILYLVAASLVAVVARLAVGATRSDDGIVIVNRSTLIGYSSIINPYIKLTKMYLAFFHKIRNIYPKQKSNFICIRSG